MVVEYGVPRRSITVIFIIDNKSSAYYPPTTALSVRVRPSQNFNREMSIFLCLRRSRGISDLRLCNRRNQLAESWPRRRVIGRKEKHRWPSFSLLSTATTIVVIQ